MQFWQPTSEAGAFCKSSMPPEAVILSLSEKYWPRTPTSLLRPGVHCWRPHDPLSLTDPISRIMDG